MSWLLQLLKITSMATPDLKAAIRKAIDDLEAHARSTKLPVDDLAVGVLKTICTLLGLY